MQDVVVTAVRREFLWQHYSPSEFVTNKVYRLEQSVSIRFPQSRRMRLSCRYRVIGQNTDVGVAFEK